MQFQKIILVVFIFFGFLVSCNNDDDNQETTNNHAIHGTWNLTNVSGGIIGIDNDYNSGQVIWTFNETNNQLDVEYNIVGTPGPDPEITHGGLMAGNYMYEIRVEEESDVLYVNDNQLGTIIISNNTLIIDQRYSDGYAHTFKR